MSSSGDVTRIVTAAWTVLERSSFRSLKVRQVLAASGTSANVFYRHFPSKADLVLALLDSEMARASAHLGSVMGDAVGNEAQLRAWVAHNVSIAYDEKLARRARLFLDPHLTEAFPREVAALNARVIDPLLYTIRQGVTDGDFRTSRAEADAQAVYHLLRGFLVEHLLGLLATPEGDVVELVSDFALRALGVPSPES